MRERRSNPQRELGRDEQPRTVRIGKELEPRVCRADERLLVEQAELRRRAEERHRIAEQNARLARNVGAARAAIAELGDGLERIDKRTRKELQHIRSLIQWIQERHTEKEPE